MILEHDDGPGVAYLVTCGGGGLWAVYYTLVLWFTFGSRNENINFYRLKKCVGGEYLYVTDSTVHSPPLPPPPPSLLVRTCKCNDLLNIQVVWVLTPVDAEDGWVPSRTEEAVVRSEEAAVAAIHGEMCYNYRPRPHQQRASF